MSEIIEGRDLMFFVAGTSTGTYKSIAAATNASIEISMDTKDVITKDSANGAWTTVTPNKLSWSGSSDNLFELEADGAAYDTLFEYMTNKTKVYVKFGTAKNFTASNGWTLNQGLYSGEVYITSLSLSAGADDNAQFSVSFTGTGALTKITAAA